MPGELPQLKENPVGERTTVSGSVLQHKGRGRNGISRTKKPKVQIKRQKTSLGWAYRTYVDGTYMGTGLTQASARTGAQRMLAN